MKWLRKEVFPDKTPAQILELARERGKESGSLYAAVSHEARDVLPRGGKVKLAKAERPIAFRAVGDVAKGEPKPAHVLDQYKTAVQVALLKAGYNGKPIRVINWHDIPAATREAIGKEPAGWISPTGEMTVVASAHSSPESAVYTAFHEAFHRGELGTEAAPYMKAMERARGNKTIEAIAQKIEESDSATKGTLATREALAEVNAAARTGDWKALAERYGVSVDEFSRAGARGAVKQFIQRAKEFFGKLFGLKMNDAEVRTLVDSVFENINKPIINKEGGPLFARDEPTLPVNKENAVLDKIKAGLKDKYKAGKLNKEEFLSKLHAAEDRFKPAAQESKFSKGLQLIKDVNRALKLSSLTAIPKLMGAAGFRIVGSPAEQAIVSLLRKAPIINKIAEGSKRYAGFNPEAEKAALKATFSLDTLKQTWKVLTKGEIDIDKFRDFTNELASRSGENEIGFEGKLSRPVLDFFTRVHAAIKTPVKLNEFARSQTMRTHAAIAEGLGEGLSPKEAIARATSPEMQEEIGIQAYIDSQRSVLLGNNKLYSAIENALKTGKTSDNLIAQALAHTAEILTPVRKVPTNILTEASEHAFGLANAVTVIRKGIKNLTSEERDYILRNLSKQTIGAALTAVVLAGFMRGGGYYSGPKDYQAEIPVGDIKVGNSDTHVPHVLTHAPMVEIVQMLGHYAKLRERGASMGQAGLGTAGAFAETNVPILDQTVRFVKAVKGSKKEWENYVNNMVKGFTVPGLLSSSAKYIDEARNPEVADRKTPDLASKLQSGIPGMREQLAPIMEHRKKGAP